MLAALLDLPQDAVQPVAHGLHGKQQAGLVALPHRHIHVQLAPGDLPGDLGGIGRLTAHLTEDAHGDQHTEHQHRQRGAGPDPGHADLGELGGGLGGIGLRRHIDRVHLHQLGEQLLGGNVGFALNTPQHVVLLEELLLACHFLVGRQRLDERDGVLVKLLPGVPLLDELLPLGIFLGRAGNRLVALPDPLDVGPGGELVLGDGVELLLGVRIVLPQRRLVGTRLEGDLDFTDPLDGDDRWQAVTPDLLNP